MTSLAQLAANKANAQHSTGPKSEAAKTRTRLNGYRHGLTGQIYIFTAEEQQAFDLHCAGIREALDPVGGLELELAQSIAEDRWRLKRARALESGIFALGQPQPGAGDPGQNQINEALAQARTWLTDGKQLQLLSLYEQRIHRTVEKTMAQLEALQAKRKAIAEQAIEEAQLLAQLAYSNGEKYDAAQDFPPELLKNGSGFSTASINRLILRSRRLAEARYYAGQKWSKRDPFRKPAVEIPKAA